MLKKLLSAALIFCTCQTCANESVSQEPFFLELDEALRALENPPKFGAQAAIVQTGHPEFKNASASGQSLFYRQWHAQGVCLFMPSNCETMIVALGGGNLTLDWKENPYFHHTEFSSVKTGLLLTSCRLRNWFWQAGISDRFDPHESFSLPYCRYSTQIWGRYSFGKTLGLHMGLMSQFGLKSTDFYPIIGFDYQLACQWKINVVYPTNLSLVCCIDNHWSLSIAERFFKTRYRVRKGEPDSCGIFEYRNVGTELDLHYRYQSLSIKAYTGATYGTGELEIYSSQGHSLATLNIKASWYGGLNFSLLF